MSTRYEDLRTLHSISPSNPIVFDRRIYNVDDPLHWHENIEMLYFLDGECNVLNGNEILHVKTGDIIIFNSGSVHSVMCKSSNAEFACIIIDSQFCENFGFPVNDFLFYKKIKDEKIGSLIEKIINTPKGDKLFNQSIRVFAFSILLLLFKKHTVGKITEFSNTGKTELVKKIIKYIKHNYGQQVCMGDVEEYCGYSRYYLSKIFRDTTGKTIMGYLNEVRINAAKELLTKTDLDIKTIAEDCGFECQSYFGKVFKKSEGISPLNFRNFKEN